MHDDDPILRWRRLPKIGNIPKRPRRNQGGAQRGREGECFVSSSVDSPLGTSSDVAEHRVFRLHSLIAAFVLIEPVAQPCLSEKSGAKAIDRAIRSHPTTAICSPFFQHWSARQHSDFPFRPALAHSTENLADSFLRRTVRQALHCTLDRPTREIRRNCRPQHRGIL